MKKTIGLFSIFLLAIGLVLTSQAGAVTIWANDAIWSPGTNAQIGNPQRGIVDNALGEPDDLFLSLGLGGFAIFDFGSEFSTSAVVFETTWGNRADYFETASVFVADSSVQFDLGDFSLFTKVADIDNQQEEISIILSGGPFQYLAVLDTTPNMPNGDGFDINAVGVNPVPEPSTWALMAIGLLGIVGLRKKVLR